eukprot:scaffold417819_cov20-Prasinocladus_malaysianus.AAC.1
MSDIVTINRCSSPFVMLSVCQLNSYRLMLEQCNCRICFKMDAYCQIITSAMIDGQNNHFVTITLSKNTEN